VKRLVGCPAHHSCRWGRSRYQSTNTTAHSTEPAPESTGHSGRCFPSAKEERADNGWQYQRRNDYVPHGCEEIPNQLKYDLAEKCDHPEDPLHNRHHEVTKQYANGRGGDH